MWVGNYISGSRNPDFNELVASKCRKTLEVSYKVNCKEKFDGIYNDGTDLSHLNMKKIYSFKYKTRIVLENSCSLNNNFRKKNETKGKSLQEKVLLTNFANPYMPGLDDLMSNTQEEILLLNSNLYKHLIKPFYPLGERDVIISENVDLFNSAYGNVDIITSAAIIQPKLAPGTSEFPDATYFLDSDRKLMQEKIEDIYLCGYYGEYEKLIIGAFGCGDFRNPISEVVKIFNDMNKKYDGCFKDIIFPVLYNKDMGPRAKKCWDIFNEKLENKVSGIYV